MNLLTPWTAAIAAAASVPLLLLLYFLKLRRISVPVSSTLLWKKSIQDLQVNAPFQKLRRNLLLFLQLLVLAAAVFALGTPMTRWSRPLGKKIILLIDHSASMNTLEDDGPRLERARRAAGDYLRGLQPDDEAMVIEFAASARVVCQFTTDVGALERAVDSIRPTDEPSRIAEALQLATAYSAPTRLEPVPGAQPAPEAQIELFSDGRIADADQEVLQRGRMRFYAVGAATDNVGIVAMDVRRAYDRPGHVTVFAQLENFGPAAVASNVILRLDGRDLAVKEVALGAALPEETASQPTASQAASPPARAVVFELEQDSGGVLEVKLEREDKLAVDNLARMSIDPPRRASALIVTDRERVRQLLEKAFSGLPMERVERKSTAEYEAAPDDQLVQDGRPVYDLVILDAHSTAKLPPGGYFFLGGVPRIEGVSAGDVIEDDRITTWDDSHPLMRYVDFENVTVARWRKLTLPSTAVPLVEGERSLLLAYLPAAGRQFVIAAFDLADTDWWRRIPFVVFMFNATRLLAGDGGAMAAAVQPGDTIVAPPLRAGKGIRVDRPDGTRDAIESSGAQQPIYARTDLSGLYTFRGDSESARVAVNLLDRNESRIRPRDQFVLGAERIAQVSTERPVNQPLWPLLVCAAIAVLLFEWWIYNRRVML